MFGVKWLVESGGVHVEVPLSSRMERVLLHSRKFLLLNSWERGWGDLGSRIGGTEGIILDLFSYWVEFFIES